MGRVAIKVGSILLITLLLHLNPSLGQNSDRIPPVVIIEFGDLECPFSKRAVPTIKQIKSTYGGNVSVEFKHFPLGHNENAQNAAEAAECARDQGKFWEMHDILFDNQQDLSVEAIKGYAQDIGLDTDAFNECLDTDEKAQLVRDDMAEGQVKGVSGTPDFFIQGKDSQGRPIEEQISGAQPYAVFEEVIERLLTGKRLTDDDPELKVTILTNVKDPACQNDHLVDALKNLFPTIKDSKVDITSNEGKALIDKYSIAIIPKFIIEGKLDGTYNWNQNVGLRNVFEKKDDVWIILDDATGADCYVSEDARKNTEEEKCAKVPKAEVPTMNIFVVAYCPFGIGALKGIQSVVDLLGDKIKVEPHYIIYENYGGGGPDYCMAGGKYCSMHGIQELNEGVRQLCLYKYQPEVWWDYFSLVSSSCNSNNVDDCWEGQAQKASVDIATVKKCFEEEALDILAEEVKLNAKYNARGSPTMVLNEGAYDGKRDSESFKLAICCGFSGEWPVECGEEQVGCLEVTEGDDNQATCACRNGTWHDGQCCGDDFLESWHGEEGECKEGKWYEFEPPLLPASVPGFFNAALCKLQDNQLQCTMQFTNLGTLPTSYYYGFVADGFTADMPFSVATDVKAWDTQTKTITAEFLPYEATKAQRDIIQDLGRVAFLANLIIEDENFTKTNLFSDGLDVASLVGSLEEMGKMVLASKVKALKDTPSPRWATAVLDETKAFIDALRKESAASMHLTSRSHITITTFITDRPVLVDGKYNVTFKEQQMSVPISMQLDTELEVPPRLTMTGEYTIFNANVSSTAPFSASFDIILTSSAPNHATIKLLENQMIEAWGTLPVSIPIPSDMPVGEHKLYLKTRPHGTKSYTKSASCILVVTKEQVMESERVAENDTGQATPLPPKTTPIPTLIPTRTPTSAPTPIPTLQPTGVNVPVCGDLKCDVDENSKTCCTDCGCDPGDRCRQNQCIKIETTPSVIPTADVNHLTSGSFMVTFSHDQWEGVLGDELPTSITIAGVPDITLTLDATFTGGSPYRTISKELQVVSGREYLLKDIGLRPKTPGLYDVCGVVKGLSAKDCTRIRILESMPSPTPEPLHAPSTEGLRKEIMQSLGIDPKVDRLTSMGYAPSGEVQVMEGSTEGVYVYQAHYKKGSTVVSVEGKYIAGTKKIVVNEIPVPILDRLMADPIGFAKDNFEIVGAIIGALGVLATYLHIIKRKTIGEEKVKVRRGVTREGNVVKVGVKVVNDSTFPLVDVGVELDVPKAFRIEGGTKFIDLGTIRQDEYQSAIFNLVPTRCVSGNVLGSVIYHDVKNNRKIIEMEPVTVGSVCPFLEKVPMDIDKFKRKVKSLPSQEKRMKVHVEPEAVFDKLENKCSAMHMVSDAYSPDGSKYMAIFTARGAYSKNFIAISFDLDMASNELVIKVYGEQEEMITGLLSEIVEIVEEAAGMNL